MFSKLLKYDFRSIRRIGVPVLIALAGATVLGSFGLFGFVQILRHSDSFAQKGAEVVGAISSTIMMTVLMFALVAITAAVTVLQVLLYVNFYKSTVSDEAYLTFTLPVTPRQILLSKTVNGVIWTLISTAAATLAFTLIIGVGLGASGLLEWVDIDLLALMKSFFGFLGEHSGLPMLLTLLLLLVFVLSVNSLLLYFMAIFYASVISRKNKVLVAIGCILAVNFIYSAVSSVVQTLGLLFSFPLLGSIWGWNLILTIAVLAVSALTVLFFILTQRMMEKKLNLA